MPRLWRSEKLSPHKIRWHQKNWNPGEAACLQMLLAAFRLRVRLSCAAVLFQQLLHDVGEGPVRVERGVGFEAGFVFAVDARARPGEKFRQVGLGFFFERHRQRPFAVIARQLASSFFSGFAPIDAGSNRTRPRVNLRWRSPPTTWSSVSAEIS